MRLNAPAARLILSVLPAVPTVLALLSALALFALFLLVQGQPALDALGLIFQGAFGSSFAWQNTLLRASPLMLTALCVALPAQEHQAQQRRQQHERHDAGIHPSGPPVSSGSCH